MCNHLFVRIMATDALVLKHETISIRNTDPFLSCHISFNKYTAHQLYEITLLVAQFCHTTGENLCQYKYKAPENIQKTSRHRLKVLFSTISLVQPRSGCFIEILPISPKGNVAHLCWSHSFVSSRCMQIISNQSGNHANQYCYFVIIENIVWFSGVGLSQKQMVRITGLLQGAV